MNIFKKLFSRKKNKNQNNQTQQNEVKNLSGDFSNQIPQDIHNSQNQNIQNVAYDPNNEATKKPFAPASDSLYNTPSQNIDYEWIARQQYESSKNIASNNDLYNDLNTISYYDSGNFPFEDKYTQRSGDIYYKNKNDSRLKKGVDFNTTLNYINSDKETSIFKSDKLYTLDELKVYKIPLSKTIKVFDDGLVFFKIKESIDLTPQEANVYVFKKPYDISKVTSSFDNNLGYTQQVNEFNFAQNFNSSNVSPNPKLLYRVSNISFQNQNGILSNVSFDIFGSEITAILSLDNLSNFLLENVLKGVYKSFQGSIYFNESILPNNYQTKFVNIGDSVNRNSKSSILKHISHINYLRLCSIDPKTKVGPAFEIVCGFFGIQLNRNLFGNLLQLTNFLKLTQSSVKDLQGLELDKFNTILDLLLGRKIIFIESLIADLDNLTKQNLLAFLHNYITATSTACLLVTNNIQDACMFADKFIVIKSGSVFANFTKWDVPQNEPLDSYLVNVIYNNPTPQF